MANEKTKAEQYREERKARIAETAKKNAKNMEKSNAAKRIASKVISIVLVAAIAIVAVGYCLSYYGVPERMLKIGGVGDAQSISAAEYEFYYMSVYNDVCTMQQQYAQYGQDLGFDTSLPVEEQTGTTQNEDGEEVSWQEFIHDRTLSQIQIYKALYTEAVNAGLELDEADKASIEKEIDEFREQADSNGYSLNAFLRKTYGNAVNKRLLKKELEIQVLARKYYTTRSEELAESYEQADIDAIYNKDKDAYDLVSYRIYTFAPATLEQGDDEDDATFEAREAKEKANTKANADAFYKAVTDEKTFLAKANELNKDTEGYDAATATKGAAVLKADISSNYSEDLANWLFNASTKVGDKKIISDTDTGTYYVALLTEGKHQVNTVAVRHILFMTTDQSTGEALSDEEIAAAKKNAEDALKSWQDGDKTEDSFAAIANDLSEDTGSNTNGGLYDSVLPGQMVTEFDSWCFDSDRKPGDTEIVETDYGYHVMYFVGENGKYYDETIRAEKAAEDIETESTEITEKAEYKVGVGPRRTEYAEKKVMKKIKRLLEIYNANSQYSY